MDQVHFATEQRKGKHLSYEERIVIQIRLKDGWTPNRIAREIGCAPNTVRNEIKRGTVALYRADYKASAGQAAYKRIVNPVAAIMSSLKKVPLSPM